MPALHLLAGGWLGLPADVIQVDLGVVAQTAFVGSTAVGVLHAVCVEGLNLAVVFGDDQLHQDFALGGQQQPLQLSRVLQFCERLRMLGKLSTIQA